MTFARAGAPVWHAYAGSARCQSIMRPRDHITAEDLPRRRPVWEALSGLFLDGEIDDAQRWRIVAVLRASGYHAAELDRIFRVELCPVLHGNLRGVAGEWAGFDMAQVEAHILTHPAGRVRQWWAYLNCGHVAHAQWRRVRKLLEA